MMQTRNRNRKNVNVWVIRNKQQQLTYVHIKGKGKSFQLTRWPRTSGGMTNGNRLGLGQLCGLQQWHQTEALGEKGDRRLKRFLTSKMFIPLMLFVIT